MLIVKIFYLSLFAQHHSPLITQDWKNFDITIEYSIWGIYDSQNACIIHAVLEYKSFAEIKSIPILHEGLIWTTPSLTLYLDRFTCTACILIESENGAFLKHHEFNIFVCMGIVVIILALILV